MAETLNTLWTKSSGDSDEPEITKAMLDNAIVSAYSLGGDQSDLIIAHPYMVATLLALKRFGQRVNRANRHKYRRSWLAVTQTIRVR